MVMVTCSFEPISKCLWCKFAHSPLTFTCFATVFCKVIWEHILYVLGVLFCKVHHGEALMVFCATHVARCDHLIQELSNLSACSISTSVYLKCCSSDLFKSCSLSSSSSSQPLAYCHMQCGWFPNSCCTFYVSSSPTLLRFRNHCLLSCCLILVML